MWGGEQRTHEGHHSGIKSDGLNWSSEAPSETGLGRVGPPTLSGLESEASGQGAGSSALAPCPVRDLPLHLWKGQAALSQLGSSLQCPRVLV